MNKLGRIDFRRVLVGLFVLSVLGFSSPVQAGQSGSKARAKEYFFKGISAFKVQNYAVALVWFQRSYKLRPKAVVLYNIAMCHRALFAYLKSIKAFKRYLAMAGSKVRPSKRRKIEGFIQEMMAKLARVVLAVQPSGARILLDGEFKGTAPSNESITLMASPGTHVLEVTKPGYRSYRRNITVVEGQQTALSVILPKIGPAEGTLILESPVSGAMAIVDRGTPMPLPVTLQVTAGAHNITVTAPGRQPKAMVLSVQPGAVLRQMIHLKPSDGTGARPARPAVILPRQGHPTGSGATTRAVPRHVTNLTPGRRSSHESARTVPPAAVQPTPARQGPSWYKTWWFWTSVGVAVVAGAALGGYFGYEAAHSSNAPSADTIVTLK